MTSLRRALVAGLSVLATTALASCSSQQPPLDAGPLPNLELDALRTASSVRVVWQHFEADDCALVEGCVAEPGWRRLLRFDTLVRNVGEANLDLGVPSDDPERFVFSPCHGHYHFEGFADYRLRDQAGAELAVGHKQAFCLEDRERDGEGGPRVPRFTCAQQGISVGWSDLYDASLPCQWIDVTDVVPGDYELTVALNGERTILESSYEPPIEVDVTIPADDGDPLAPCDETLAGDRDCGWTVAARLDCEPRTQVDVGCGSGCGLGACDGRRDAILRVCPGETACASRSSLAFADQGCGGGCPLATDVECPAEGRVTVLVAPQRDGRDADCAPALRP